MKQNAIPCPNCGSVMKKRKNSIDLICEYCLTEIFMGKEDPVAEKAKPNVQTVRTNNSGVEKAQIELEKQRLAQKHDSSQRNKELISKVLFPTIVVLASVFLIVFLFDMLSNFDSNDGSIVEKTVNISMPFSAKDLKGESFVQVTAKLEDVGFKDIEQVKVEDLKFGILKKDGQVKSVTINGNEKFTDEDRFMDNSKVKVYYHTFPEKEVEEIQSE